LPRLPLPRPGTAEITGPLRRRFDVAGSWRRPLGIHRYFAACFGIATTGLGLALTVSALALMYAGNPAAEASGLMPSPLVHLQQVIRAEASVETSPASVPDAIAAGLFVPTEPAGGDNSLSAAPARESADGPSHLELIQAIVAAQPPAADDPDNARTLHALGLSTPATAPGPPAGLVDGAALDAAEPPTVSEPLVPPDPPAPAELPPGPAPNAAPAMSAAGLELARVWPGIPVLRTIRNVNVTFYDCAKQGFCGNMANGRKVYQGAAACSYDLPFNTRFYIQGDPTGRIYRCEDRGLLANTWVDIFWYHPSDGWKWQEAVGRLGTIHIVEWGR